MKRNEILGEQKKGVKAVKYNKKPKDTTAEYGKAKEKLAPQKPLEEGVEDRISYQVAKVLHDNGVTYDPAREDELINVIGLALVKKLDMTPKEARAIMNDEDFLGDTMGELRHMEQGVAEGFPKDPNAPKLVRDRKTGKQYDPNKEFEKKMTSPDVMAQMKRMAQKEGYRDRRDAYQRDYDSSVSGMGRKDSLAYRMDGGANDEGEQDDPTPQRRAAPKGMYFYNVPADKEDQAKAAGLFQTRSGKWYSPFENTRANMFFGRGRFWQPKSESTNESVKKVDAPKPRNFVAKNAKMGGAGQHKDKKKAQKQGDAKHKKPVYETGALKVQKDDDKATVLLNPATGVQTQIDKTNPNAPRLAQDPTGKLKLSMPTGGQTGGTEQKPNLVGKDVSIDSAPVEDVHRVGASPSQPGGEITDVNPRSPISGDEEHDEISKLLNQRLRKLAGL